MPNVYHLAGKKQAITIRSSGGLSDAEIDRMVNEAESMRETDQRKKDDETGWRGKAGESIHGDFYVGI